MRLPGLTQNGTYSVTVASNDGSVGRYTLGFYLNSDVEEEELGGGTNDTPAAAQSMDRAFAGVPRHAVGARRAAVAGAALPPPAAQGAVHSMRVSSPAPLAQHGAPAVPHRPAALPLPPPRYRAASGQFALLMDDTASNGNSSLNEAIWEVDLSGVPSPILSFNHTTLGEYDDPLPPTFSGHADGDGVCVSVDGVNWVRVWQGIDSINGTFANVTLDLGAAARAAGISLGANTRIKFQQYGEFRRCFGRRVWDDVTILKPVAAQ